MKNIWLKYFEHILYNNRSHIEPYDVLYPEPWKTRKVFVECIAALQLCYLHRNDLGFLDRCDIRESRSIEFYAQQFDKDVVYKCIYQY